MLCSSGRRQAARNWYRIGEFWSWWSADALPKWLTRSRGSSRTTTGVLSEHVGRLRPPSTGARAGAARPARAGGDRAVIQPPAPSHAAGCVRAAVGPGLGVRADLRRPAPDVTIQFDGWPPVEIGAGLVAIDPDSGQRQSTSQCITRSSRNSHRLAEAGHLPAGSTWYSVRNWSRLDRARSDTAVARPATQVPIAECCPRSRRSQLIMSF